MITVNVQYRRDPEAFYLWYLSASPAELQLDSEAETVVFAECDSNGVHFADWFTLSRDSVELEIVRPQLEKRCRELEEINALSV